MTKIMRHGSLFSGIGGFDLAAEWRGWKNVFHCEINEFCRWVLKYYWPGSKGIENIKGYDWTKWKGKIDVLSGGFPCQPFSVAGRRQGKDDDRYLWPQMCRAIHEIQPRWVVAENVLGLTSWNGGMVFEEVWSQLEGAGYCVQPFVLPAAGVGAPHRRDRVWFVAWLPEAGMEQFFEEVLGYLSAHPEFPGYAADTDGFGRGNGSCDRQGGPVLDNFNRHAQEAEQERKIRQRGPGKTGPASSGARPFRYEPDFWKDWPTVPPVCLPNDGFSYRVDADTIFEGIPFPDKPISFPKWRQESIKAMGNAIVPQVAYQIFQVIDLMSDPRKLRRVIKKMMQ